MKKGFSAVTGCALMGLLLCGCGKSGNPASAPAAQPASTSSDLASDTVSPAESPAFKAPPPGPPVILNGQTVDVGKAEKALAASYKLQAVLADARFALRYTDYDAALAALQKAAADPALTDDQKNVIAEVISQVKQAALAAPKPASK